ncbi:MAG: CIA30 family protein, partial [Planctomycetota bacterium]
MKMKKHLCVLLFLLLSFLSFAVLKGSVAKQPSGAEAKVEKPARTVLIDDFSPKRLNKKSTTKWQFVADRTRAGRSEGKVALVEHDGRSCLHLTGPVSAKNNAGFIQAKAGLASRNRNFDAGAFNGISLRLKGNGRPYAI